MDFLILLLGLAVLVFGGELLVKGAVGFSTAFKVSPLVIGMTVVSFGTSAPELIVSLQSAIAGNPGIAIGNIVGSNIVNITAILGITVLVCPIIVDRQSKIIDYPMMLVASLVFFLFSWDHLIAWWEGAVLFAMLIGFTTYLIVSSRKKTKKEIAEADSDVVETMKYPFWKSGLFVAVGLVALFFGSDWFVLGAGGIAETLLADNPDKDSIIGVTVVAFGTSTPELVASVVAAYRKESGIALGNLIGSNIFNIFGVIGVVALVKPTDVAENMLSFDYVWMLIAAGLLFFVLWFGNKIGRFKGALLVLTYVVYITMIIMIIKGML